MTTIAAFPLLTGPAAKGWSGRVRGVEKSKARRQFDGECATQRLAQTRIARPSAGCTPCQFGTNEHASFWNGERLTPAFAAQVLGQAMGKPRAQNPSVRAAYGNRTVGIAPFIDESL
jgi:hypothetical protein